MSLPPRKGGRGAGGPGGRSASVRPSALPGRATMRASLAMRRSWGARPTYCSGSLSRAAPGHGPCVILVRWCGFARLSQPPREQAVGGAGTRGVWIQLCPPLGVSVPRGGRRSGATMARRPGGGVGGRGEGGPRRCSPHPCPGGVARGPRPCLPSSPAHPPWVYTFSRGYRAAVGAGRGLVGRRWVSVAGGGGQVSLPRSAPPPSPGRHQGGPIRLHIPGCRRSVAAHSAGAEQPVGSGQCRSECGRLARGYARRGCGVPPLGAAALSGGVRGRRLSGQPLAAHGTGLGNVGDGGVGARGGSPQSPRGPLAPSPDGRGAEAWWFWSRGTSRRLEGRTLPPPYQPFACHTLVQALARAPCSPRCPRAVPAGRGGGGGGPASAGGGSLGQSAAVCGRRGSGPPLALVAPVLSPTGGGARTSAAPYGGGGVGRGGRLRWGGHPAALSPPHPLALIAWAGGVRPSPASSLVWGLGLRRRRVPPAVAPVGEGFSQSPGEPVVGICIRDAVHCPPLQESWPRRLPV